MSVQVLVGKDQATLYDDTTDWALGPVANDCDGCDHTAEEVLNGFLNFAEFDREVRDVRRLSNVDLAELWKDYMTDHHDHDEVKQ